MAIGAPRQIAPNGRTDHRRSLDFATVIPGLVLDKPGHDDGAGQLPGKCPGRPRSKREATTRQGIARGEQGRPFTEGALRAWLD